ncbi:MAG: peptide deformylase [Candidatus Eutrophobiaceae bacterium]
MSILNVLSYPDERLRIKAKPIERLDSDTQTLAADMLDTMYDLNGIGLAATQVNSHVSLAVIDFSETRDQPMILVNPEIIKTRGEILSREGCLSVPNFFDQIPRAEWVCCRFQDLQGQWQSVETAELLAIIIQHEIDHLNGKLFVDHLSPLKRHVWGKKYLKRHKSNANAQRQ